MTDGYNLEFHVKDLFVSQLCASHEAAVGCFYEHLLEYYPEETDLAGLPEPITENDLRAVIVDLGLKASFSIAPA